jgi:hypothetical protein
MFGWLRADAVRGLQKEIERALSDPATFPQAGS